MQVEDDSNFLIESERNSDDKREIADIIAISRPVARGKNKFNPRARYPSKPVNVVYVPPPRETVFTVPRNISPHRQETDSDIIALSSPKQRGLQSLEEMIHESGGDGRY